MNNGDVFGDVFSTYTDAQACGDGIVIAISANDRVMRTVFTYLSEKAPATIQPPSRWPVDMMGWFRAANIKKTEAQRFIAERRLDAQRLFDKMVRDRKALALCRGLIDRDRQRATRVCDQNIDGGFFELWVTETNGQLAALSETETPNSTKLWLIPNEVGGMTLMFPSDY